MDGEIDRGFASYAALSAARAEVLPARLLGNPVRTAPLELLRRRNALLDAVFYDVGAISDVEAESLAPWFAHEGAILLVPPTGRGTLTVFEDLAAFRASGDLSAKAIAVAGVGSSALGAAALARNVADARDENVVAVVSGYGFSDVLTEALGGWFWFGALNSLRHMFDGLDRVTQTLTEPVEQLIEAIDGVATVRLSPDTATVADLLGDPAFGFDLLVGHSKGNLVLSEALYWLKARDPRRIAAVGASHRIVTLCAKVGMPEDCRRVFDVTGEYDLLGALNSRPDIRSDLVVPHAWHSTNPASPWQSGLDATAAVKSALAALDRPMRNQIVPPPRPDVPQTLVAAIAQPR
jgi:hypothetical protein